jgi:alkanesulfonate monooxygenase SsuD/methylene tetrahydromethanopterin reductase-like flavin-dependent oxidoreductase (luciferase family)
MLRAARHGDAWLPYMYTPEQLAQSLELIDGLLTAEGRQPRSVRPGLFIFVSVDRDGVMARRRAIEYVGGIYRQDFSHLVDRYVLAGTPADCRRRLEEYARAGATAILTNLACPDDEKLDMLRLFADEVMPEFRHDLGGTRVERTEVGT